MGCNCKGKKNVINNLDNPSYVQVASDIWAQIQNTPFEEITDQLWEEMYMVYGMIFPNSTGLPVKEELVQIIQNATQYKTKRRFK
jgi:hypothetical protein